MISFTKSPESIFKNIQTTQIFDSNDPEKCYNNFIEVGKGSFGTVYCAQSNQTNENYAIKKINFSGKNSLEKCQEILKEVEFMSQITHVHCVNFKAFHIKDSCAWIVMDYCLGSALDVIDAVKSTLNEKEISIILKDSLKGLRFIHSLNKIHRDIKAANILITSQGIVKLGDFGSVSSKSPANSFIGTPFWMAPELILAMEDGDYDCKIDIWSLGITAIELIDCKPPLFHMNAMSALYHISQNTPPSAINTKISDDLKNFVSVALTKDPNDRPTSDQLILHKFLINDSDDRIIIINLLARVSEIVSSRDNRLNERIKVLVIDDNESESTESKSIEFKFSEKSDIESNQSFELDVPSIESKNSSEEFCDDTDVNAISVILNKDIKQRTLKNNFQTIKSAYSLIDRDTDMNSLDIKAYRNARRENQAYLVSRKQKNSLELNELKRSHEKAYELLLANNERELEKLRFKHKMELENLQKIRLIEEKKLIKHSNTLLEKRMKDLDSELNIFYKEQKKQLSKNFQGENKQNLVSNLKESFINVREDREKTILAEIKYSLELDLNEFYATHSLNEQNTEYLMLLEELNMLNVHLETVNMLILKQYDAVSNLELDHLKALNVTRRDQLNKLHVLEKQNQQNHSKQQLLKLKKSHLTDYKNKPKEIKVVEKQIRRLYENSIRVQSDQYKMLLKQTLLKSSKENHQKIREDIENQRRKKLTELTAQFEINIADINNKENTKMSEVHSQQKEQLENRLKMECEDLMANQINQLASLDQHITHQLNQLKQRITSDKAILERKLAESLEIFKTHKNDRLASLKLSQNEMKEPTIQIKDINRFIDPSSLAVSGTSDEIFEPDEIIKLS